MSKQISFTKYEREILPQLRDNLNKAESTEDVRKFFAYAIMELFEQVFGPENIKIKYDDIRFQPGKSPFYKISERICLLDEFASIWSSSDLSTLVSNMAQAAKNRYTRLGKNFDKTEAKIRSSMPAGLAS